MILNILSVGITAEKVNFHPHAKRQKPQNVERLVFLID